MARTCIQNQCLELSKKLQVSASIIIRILARKEVFPYGTDLAHIGKLNTNSVYVEKELTQNGRLKYSLTQNCIDEIEREVKEREFSEKRETMSSFEDFVNMVNDYQKMKKSFEEISRELEAQIEINDELKIKNHELSETNAQLMKEKQELNSSNMKEKAGFKERFSAMNEKIAIFTNDINKSYSDLYEVQKHMANINTMLAKIKNDTNTLQRRMDNIFREAKDVLNAN